jgi:hypothetical protein
MFFADVENQKINPFAMEHTQKWDLMMVMNP